MSQSRSPASPTGASETVAAVIDALRKGIQDGRWAPGQRLIEADLCEELGVGRGPVREALRILSGDGLIELIPNRGARIRRVNRKEAAEILQVIAALQFLAADLLAQQSLTPHDVATLEAATDAVDSAIAQRDKAAIMKAALAYQVRCNILCGNPYIDFTMRRMNVGNLASILAAAVPLDVLISATDHHRALTDALVGKKRSVARKLMQASYQRLMRAYDEATNG